MMPKTRAIPSDSSAYRLPTLSESMTNWTTCRKRCSAVAALLEQRRRFLHGPGRGDLVCAVLDAEDSLRPCRVDVQGVREGHVDPGDRLLVKRLELGGDGLTLGRPGPLDRR